MRTDSYQIFHRSRCETKSTPLLTIPSESRTGKISISAPCQVRSYKMERTYLVTWLCLCTVLFVSSSLSRCEHYFLSTVSTVR